MEDYRRAEQDHHHQIWMTKHEEWVFIIIHTHTRVRLFHLHTTILLTPHHCIFPPELGVEKVIHFMSLIKTMVTIQLVWLLISKYNLISFAIATT